MHILQERLLSLARHQDLGKMPLRQITRLVNERHPQTVKHHLLQLEKKGLIKVDSANGSILVTTPRQVSSVLVSVPILGSTNCGDATIYAEENIEGYLQVSEKLLRRRPSQLFALIAQGDSMDNATSVPGGPIEPGDYVVVDGDDRDPQDGDYIVSVIDGMANIKRYRLDMSHNRIVLVSESKRALPPIFIHEEDNYLINGKVIQVFKPLRAPR